MVFSGNSAGERIIGIERDGRELAGFSESAPGGLPDAGLTYNSFSEAVVTAWKKGTYSLKTSAGKIIDLTFQTEPEAVTVDGPWDVRFPHGWGAPTVAKFPGLISWTEHRNEGIKYFSGIARYLKKIHLDKNAVSPDTRVLLDLGRVGLIAGRVPEWKAGRYSVETAVPAGYNGGRTPRR